MKKLFVSLLGLGCYALQAQDHFPRNDVADTRLEVYAFLNARIFIDHETIVEPGTLVIKEGYVVAAGREVRVPQEAVVIDVKGKTIYPSFIDPYTHYGLPKVDPSASGGYYVSQGGPQLSSERKHAYGWNDAIRAEYQAVEAFAKDEKAAKKLRAQGFGAVLSFRPDGIARGTGVLVTLSDAPVQELILQAQASAHFSFHRGTSKQEYPRSLMGAAALLRQTHYDAEWYASTLNRDQYNLSLEAIRAQRSLPAIFEVEHKLAALLADKVGDEIGIPYIIKDKGDAYQHLEAIKATQASFILPLNYPKPYDVEDPYDALEVSLRDMKHWDMMPAQAGMFEKAGIPFAFTAHGLSGKELYLKHIRKAITHGLSKEGAFQAMTGTPARLLRVADKVGALRQGMVANFIITSGDIFDEQTTIYENWIQGRPYVMADKEAPDYAGTYALDVSDSTYQLQITGKVGKQKAALRRPGDTTDIDTKISIRKERIGLRFSLDGKNDIRLSGWREAQDFKGRGQLPGGRWVDWEARYESPAEADTTKQAADEMTDSEPEPGRVLYPFTAYGNEAMPASKTYLIRGATVWTNEAEGVQEGLEVLIQAGKIAAVGTNLEVPAGAEVVNATGKHLSPGIVDEHSHIALFSINEWSEAVSAEVQMYDVVNSEDVNIYRQLAGGVTSAQLLHGSANPIGGQSALVKMRWGATPEGMRIQGADGFIKFALGENVKRSNAPPAWSKRFPQTRMGVEQTIWNAFARAKDYAAAWERYRKSRGRLPQPRKDLELEAMAEILAKKRFITCHSYVQSEINMLMKLTERFGVRVNTFTHILEGYKVADKMRAHGAGGSTFSDWWAYKYEVREAIPYNAAVMNAVGVVSAVNSDDAEMGRRLNQEAAKSVKYGNTSEEDALKMVTLNPAKLLHLDNRVGSIKVGKDADLVVWSAHPLSIYAKAEKTFVDGRLYFDIEKDKARRQAILEERNRLIQKMIQAKKKGEKTQKAASTPGTQHTCETLDKSVRGE